MLIIPSVDLMHGKVVRLIRGDPRNVKYYEHLGEPVNVAKRWESEGARWVHIVDLDAALGSGNNTSVIGDIIRSLKIQAQVGGGIRSLESARQLIAVGAARIVIGSLAFKNPSTLKKLLDEFGDSRIAVALDHLDGIIKVGGWKESTCFRLREAAKLFTDMGVKFFLVTSIQRDGAMSGPDIENLNQVLDLGANVMASGGVRSLDDIAVLRDLGVYGVIVGRALYEGCFSLSEALKVALKDD
ncbi:MAG: 1-(5-phosphoribosyl)-5-[(5-phosphoribosylamino)methylideneamino]imidazole-4-carboxamide isomerase [Candidatus Bathyarchaeota archaeon]|nr:1-(5-phosphoribosyl)-5-[(5-phosphoribosylamino)methylideneamino]imidazole-4-carboxamide isomerase [Candidatus Bathyarchaeota archaeon]